MKPRKTGSQGDLFCYSVHMLLPTKHAIQYFFCVFCVLDATVLPLRIAQKYKEIASG